jgi:hypothetical protein
MWKAGLFAAGLAAAAVSNFGPAEARDAGNPSNGSDDELRAWDRKIDDPQQRFEVLDDFHGHAVLDRETQLVWQQDPGLNGFFHEWSEAVLACPKLSVDNRLGWRLPTVQELSTLMDPSVSPALPAGHPFSNVGSVFWTISPFTPQGVFPPLVFTVDFTTGTVRTGVSFHSVLPFLCVRGGIGSGLSSQ